MYVHLRSGLRAAPKRPPERAPSRADLQIVPHTKLGQMAMHTVAHGFMANELGGRPRVLRPRHCVSAPAPMRPRQVHKSDPAFGLKISPAAILRTLGVGSVCAQIVATSPVVACSRLQTPLQMTPLRGGVRVREVGAGACVLECARVWACVGGRSSAPHGVARLRRRAPAGRRAPPGSAASVACARHSLARAPRL